MVRERQSNIELLRLVCMFLIVVHHIVEHATGLYGSSISSTAVWGDNLILRIIDVFAYVAVPVFVMISGYFGIQFKTKGLLNFYIQCAFYAGLLYLIFMLCNGVHIKSWLFNTLLPITNNAKLWFVQCYFMLYLISPLLNKCIDYLSKREHLIALLVLMFINLYYGWRLGSGISSNVNGFNLANFVFLYFIGRYIAKHVQINSDARTRAVGILVYICGSLLLAILPLIDSYVGIIPNKYLEYRAYNMPLLLINSIGLLIAFLAMSFQSKIVNWFAASTFAVYLIHENAYIRDYWYETTANTLITPPYGASLCANPNNCHCSDDYMFTCR